MTRSCCWLEHGQCLVRQRRVLEPGAGEPGHDPLVQGRVGDGVDGRAVVLALEVDRVDGACRLELRDQLLRPVRGRVELEAQRGVELEPSPQPPGCRRLTESHRDDERQRLRVDPDDLTETETRLTEREIERGALEGPAAVVEVGVLLRLVIEER